MPPRTTGPFYPVDAQVDKDVDCKPAVYPLEFLDGHPGERTGYRTPHIHFRVSKRGFRKLPTQMYYAGQTQNEADIVLKQIRRWRGRGW